MRIVTPFDPATGKFNSLENCRNAIFLAGPCPREDFNDDWRFEAFDKLEEIEFDGVILSPTNPQFKDMVTKFGMTNEQAVQDGIAVAGFLHGRRAFLRDRGSGRSDRRKSDLHHYTGQLACGYSAGSGEGIV